MIIQENLGNGIVRTYSNAGFKVHGGYPEGDYNVVYDPEDSGREYTETDIPVDAPTPPEPGFRELSRVKLYRKFRSMGIWEQVKAWMQSQDGVWEEWEYSTTLDENNELVMGAKAALKSDFGLTDDQIETIVSESTAD
jgi:hypothetical protein